MPDNSNQPTEYDAVLGGQTPIPLDSEILGGLAGVKRRGASAAVNQRIAALSEALKYGEAGLNLVIRALEDESWEVEKAAYLLLRERVEPRVKQALRREYNPWAYFECLDTLIEGKSVFCVAISPDGQTLVSGTFWSSGIKVWNLQTGELKRTLKGHSTLSSILSVAISPDGQTLVSERNGNTISVWNLQTGELIRNLIVEPQGGLNSLAISPDGQTLAKGHQGNTISVWNLQTGELIRTLDAQRRYGREVRSVAISPDGQTLVSGCCSSFFESTDNIVQVWDLQTGELKRTLKGHSESVFSVAISPDGKTIVSGSSDNTIRSWNLQTGVLKRTLEGHSDDIYSIAISPDGQIIVSGSGDDTIKIWGLP